MASAMRKRKKYNTAQAGKIRDSVGRRGKWDEKNRLPQNPV